MIRERAELRANPPFRLDLTVWALRRRPHNAIDRWDGEQYERIIGGHNQPIKLTVIQRSSAASPALDVGIESARKLDDRELDGVLDLVRRTLGLAADLAPFYELADKDRLLKPLVEGFSGVKPPRFPSLFEALVNAVACQQVTLDVGIVLLNRLSERFGDRVVDHGLPFNAFPTPADLADTSEESIKSLGFSRQKARVIKDLALRATSGALDSAEFDGLANEEAIRRLSSIRGIGRWSAEYVLLRGLGRMDTFPGDDIGAQNNLHRLFELDSKPSYEEIRELTSAWHPYQGMVYFHLLLEKLHGAGVI